MEARLQDVLRQNIDEIASEWALRMHRASDQYARMPLGEVERGARRVVNALITAVSVEDFSDLYRALQEIAEERASLGFAPSEVSRALLIGCETVLPVLERVFADDAQQLVWSVTRIERTMHRSLALLEQAFKDTEAVREMAALRAAAGRLNVVLQAAGLHCVVVDRDLMVRWQGPPESAQADIAEGRPYPGEGQRAGSRAVLEVVARTGNGHETHEPLEDGLVRAVATRDETGQVTEVVALYWTPGTRNQWSRA